MLGRCRTFVAIRKRDELLLVRDPMVATSIPERYLLELDTKYTSIIGCRSASDAAPTELVANF